MSVSEVNGPLVDQASSRHHERASGAGRGGRRAPAAADTPQAPQDRQFAPWEHAVQGARTGYEAALHAQQFGPGQLEHVSASDRADAPLTVTVEVDDPQRGPSGSWHEAGVALARLNQNTTSTQGARDSDSRPLNVRLAQGSVHPLPGAAGTADTGVAPAALASPPFSAAPSDEVASSGGTGAPDVARMVAAQSAESGETGRVQHYGSLPVLVSGQLVELDLYALGQRAGSARGGTRRLFLSLSGTGPHPVEVVAQASDNRLKVSVESPAAVAPDALHEHVRAVGELARRLGWKFESVEHAAPAELATGEPASSQSAPDGLDRLL